MFTQSKPTDAERLQDARRRRREAATMLHNVRGTFNVEAAARAYRDACHDVRSILQNTAL